MVFDLRVISLLLITLLQFLDFYHFADLMVSVLQQSHLY